MIFCLLILKSFLRRALRDTILNHTYSERKKKRKQLMSSCNRRVSTQRKSRYMNEINIAVLVRRPSELKILNASNTSKLLVPVFPC